MTNNEKIVREFIAYFEKSWPESFDKPMEYLADDAWYQMVVPTIEPVRGKAAILESLEIMKTKVQDQKHDMLNVAANGNTVFTERCDHSLRHGQWVEVPLVAVFDLNDAGKICGWREYLDMYNNLSQHGLSFEEMQKTIKK